MAVVALFCEPYLCLYLCLVLRQSLNAIFAHKLCCFASRNRQTKRRKLYSFCFLVRKFQVQCRQEGEGIFGGIHTVGGADGEVEGGVGVAEAVGAGGFEGAINFTRGPAIGGYDLAAQGVEDGPRRSRDESPQGYGAGLSDFHCQSSAAAARSCTATSA